MLHGCITAIVTPMLNDGSIDYAGLSTLVEWQIASGVSGLAVVGSTGEAATLSKDEKIKVIQHVIALNKGRIKIIVGSGCAGTAESIAFVEEVNKIVGVDYLMCLVPYYVKPSQEGLFQHFAQVATASQHPVILYNVPGRTVANISDETILRLALAYPQIVGLKDASGDIRRCLYLMAHKPAGFSLLSGDDQTCLPFILCGGDGVISVLSNIRPVAFAEMCRLALARQVSAAMVINGDLLALNDALAREANPIPVKWGLYFEQRIASPCLRLPLTVFSSEYHAEMRTALHAID